MGHGHVLVTGAAGFIGGACVREFLARGWRVTALVHRHAPAELDAWREQGPVDLAHGSITDGPGLRQALSALGPIDAVVHCAGRASDVGRHRAFRQADLVGVQNIAQCVLALPIGRLVHISTTDVYGLHDFDDADEDTPLETRPTNPYPKYKILAEQAIRETLPPERYVILRPAAVWGPGDRTILPRVLRFLRSAPCIVHFGRWRGRNRWPLAYVGNVSRMAWAAARADEALGRAYNVLDREKTSIDEYYRLLIDLFLPHRRAIRSRTLPFWAGWLAGGASSALSWLLARDHPVFEPSLYGLRSVSHNLDFSHARSEALLAGQGLTLIDRQTALGALARWAAAI